VASPESGSQDPLAAAGPGAVPNPPSGGRDPVAGMAPLEPAAAVRRVLPPGVADILDAFAAATRGGRQVTEGTLKNAADRMSAALKDFTEALAVCDADYRIDWEPGAVVTGDTKSLSRGTALSTLVLRALAIRAGTGRPGTARERRAVWESAGVVVDDLASRVLVLNLPAEGQGLGEWLAGAGRLGVPFCITLHQLMTLPLMLRCGLVRVCENPAVLRRAAAELGPGSAPLLCTEGQPSMAFHLLAGAVTSGGGELLYHGDFDWPGVAIAGSVLSRHGGSPWRMSAADYLAGVWAGAGHLRLTGMPQPTPWDPGLAEAMAATGSVLYEESVADVLISDLPRSSG
jgi:uncharacterized protein (TIGR02679 family)